MQLTDIFKRLLNLYKGHYQPEKHFMRGPGPACEAVKGQTQ